ncbi:hypothetical protein MMC26_002154 [Xylographa opegraphella]|nr:hypothetical protein [Xylographa opegraphella]
MPPVGFLPEGLRRPIRGMKLLPLFQGPDCQPPRASYQEARSGELTLAGNDPAIVDCMIQYLYLGDYSAAATPAADPAPPQGRLVTHALVYAIADQCAIPHLQTVARQKTAAAVAFDWRDGGSDESFVQAADLAWTTTPQSDRGLRDCYLAFIDNHTAELRGSAAFFELLRRNAELVVNVVESAWDRAAAGGSSLGFGTPFVGDTEDTPWPGGKKGKKKARGRGPDGPPLLDSDLY